MQIEPQDYRRSPTFPLSFAGMNADTLSIIGSVLGTGLALAVLMMRITARLDADRRATDAKADADRRAADTKADADRRAADARADADRRAHQASMDAFRIEMREIAERQARVEGPHPDPRAPAD